MSILCAVALILPLGYGLVHSSMEKRAGEHDNRIYLFREEALEKYREEKLSPVEFISSLRQLKEDVKGHPGLYPFLLSFADELLRQEHWKEAEEVLLWGGTIFSGTVVGRSLPSSLGHSL